MKTGLVLFTVVALAFAVALGVWGIGNQAYGREPTGMMQQRGGYCDSEFQTWDAGKGYLTQYDFRDAYSGQSQKGITPEGNAYTLFNTVDSNKDNQLSMAEFCDWKGR